MKKMVIAMILLVILISCDKPEPTVDKAEKKFPTADEIKKMLKERRAKQ